MDTDRISFTIAELAVLTGIGRSTYYALWKRGAGPARIKVGKRTLITREALTAWIASLEAVGTASR